MSSLMEDEGLTIGQLAAELCAAASDDLCCAEMDDCAALAVGEKPCGGPWECAAFSKVATDSVDIERKRGNSLHESEYNETYELESDCQLVTAPDLECLNGRCKISE